MPGRGFHRIEHAPNEFAWNLLVKQIAHRIHENHARGTPAERLLQTLGSKCEVKAGFERMSGRPAKTLGKTFSVAMIATGTDLGAPGDRVPSCVGPLDVC